MDPLDALAADTTSPEATPGTAPAGQGQPTAPPSEVQPTGQGQQDAQTGLYDLSTVPDEYRSHVEQIAKDIDRNVNAKLQDAAGFRKTWEPFEHLGLHEYEPDGIGALLEFAQALADPESAREALMDLAGNLGIDFGESTAPAEEGADDPTATLQAKVDALEARLAAQDEQQELATYHQEALTAYRAEYAEVEGLNGKPFSPEEKQRLLDLAKRFQNDNDQPIKAAFELITGIAGQAETALVNGQPKAPAPAEPAGRASTAVRPVDSFEEAERIHRERNASVHA